MRFVPVVAIDSDHDCLAVYRRNLRPRLVYPTDITALIDGDIDAEPTRAELDFVRHVGRVDVLLAGPPCQGNSDLNNHTRRRDDRNALYLRVARFAKLARPAHVLVENVPTVVHGKERAVDKALKCLQSLGYHVDHGPVDLAAIGVPQKRRRHILLASRSKGLFVKDIVDRHRIQCERTVMWAIADLERETRNGVFTQPSQHSHENMKRIRFLHENGLYDLPDGLRPPCHQDGGHSYKSMYGRLRYDAPAQTITSGFGSPGQGRFIHPVLRRTLTPHEAARLQLFPDFFDFSMVGRRTKLAEMIGNAVPMKLSYVFCLELLA